MTEPNGRSKVSWPVFLSVCGLVLSLLVVGVNILVNSWNDKLDKQEKMFDLKLRNTVLESQLSQEKINTAIMKAKMMSDTDGGKHYER